MLSEVGGAFHFIAQIPISPRKTTKMSSVIKLIVDLATAILLLYILFYQYPLISTTVQYPLVLVTSITNL